MAAQRNMTTAYAQPAESMFRVEKPPVQVEVKAARPIWFTMAENLCAGAGLLLICRYGADVSLDTSLAIGASLSGILMVVRYALDEPADLVRVWIAQRAAHNEQERIDAMAGERDHWRRTATRMHDIANEYAEEIEQLRRELRAKALRSQTPTATTAQPAQAEPLMTGWKNGDPYDGMLPHQVELQPAEQTSDGDDLTDDEQAAYDILENARNFGGSITRKSCRENSAIGRRAWDRGVTFLATLAGCVEKDESGSYTLTVSVDEAYRLAGNAIDERQAKREQYGPTFTPA